MITTNRRRRRSAEPTRAIFFQLDSCRREAGLEAMILADADGLCIASAGDAANCDEFAARVSVMQRARTEFDGELWTQGERLGVRVQRFDIDGFALCLCAVGGLADERAHEVERSVRGVRRILAQA